MATATVMSEIGDPLGIADELEDEDQDEDLPQCKIKRNYACPECSYFTQNPRFYLYHLKTVHRHKIRIYECPNCLYASKHSQKLQRHVQMVHITGNDKKKEANSKSAQEYLRAVDDAEEDIGDVDEEDFFEHETDTSECYAVTEKDNGKVFECSACPFTSPLVNLVKRHEKIHSKKKLFRCSKCDYVTHMKARFTKHVKYHSMPMIKCEACDFKTPYKWNLDRHMKNHMGGGAFQCSACSFTADIKQSLTVHEMNHHVPPVGHAVSSTPSRRKNRVGASDSQPDEVQDDFLQRSVQMHAFNELALLNEIEITKKPETPPPLKKPMMKKPNSIAQFNTKELTVKIGEKVVNPGDMIQHKNGTVYVKKLKCRVCNYRAAWESEMVRHEHRVHGLEEKRSGPKLSRPIPNLIPIQNKPTGSQPGSPGPPQNLPPPQHHLMQQQARPVNQAKPVMHQIPPSHPHFQHNMNRHPFMSQHHLPPHFSQTHNLPQYPQHLPSRFAQPKHVAQKVAKRPYSINHSPQKPIPPKPSLPPPPILKIPTPTKVRNANSSPTNTAPDKTMTEKDLNDICAKSCPNSSLKDFASLMGGDEAFNHNADIKLREIAKHKQEKDHQEMMVSENQEVIEDGTKSPEGMKKKNSSFFDQLKEKFGAGESCNLICNLCGHESKCLSESLRHQKTHNIQASGNVLGSNAVFSGADLSSTRCQYCRQRCKTSADLVVHLKSCAEANKNSSELQSVDDEDDDFDDRGETDGDKIFDEGEGEEDCKSDEGYDESEGTNPPHPMENKVFVWTNLANGEEDGLDDEYECGSQSPSSDCVFGIETSPGIGAVTSKNKVTESAQTTPTKEIKPKPDNSVKKVYKCPHCSFWASTASRFHVHIVGHLNKKPFECSLCCYRSNWRWDITKHIRLKTVRDSTHQRAKVLMTDETGRRNYSKYNKYLTLMRVHEPAAESSGSGMRGKKITQSFEPIETLPTPPKLTPAPQPGDGNSLSNTSAVSAQFRTIYPKPPPLQSSFDMKRKGSGESEEEPAKKKGLLENKKTMWKCKKCLFRDSDRAVVLAHVKDHYRTQTLQDTTDERHCRLKHNGNVKVVLAPRHNSDQQERNEGENEPENYMCETCPYLGYSQQCLDDHMEKHFERPGALQKCYFCPFFVCDKEELMEHMSLHVEPEGDESSSSFKDENVGQNTVASENGELCMNKRYRCTACPYVSNSKTQFLYHKQFHRPRGAPFQCDLCSYNVPRRHFLQQHLRLHGINTPLPKMKNTECVETEMLANIKEIDTSGMAEIPLVWVSKLGSLTKMFKCRFCPHVNIRKSNIQEHEKMHAIRTKLNSEGFSPLPQQQHHCPECNYICNNAGVLSSHTKVHQGLFGQVCALVDVARSDEEQIKELNTLLGREEEGPPEITPDEINKDFKELSPQVQTPSEKDYETTTNESRILHFCSICPARFLYPKELEIHLRFHNMQLHFQCDSCSYTARQQPHLLAHYKVHTDEYQDRTNALCEVYQISEEHPKPKIAIIVDGSEEVGPAWVVVERQKMPAKDPQNEYDLDEAPSESSQHGSRIVIKQFACDKCPATFFKSVALQYHSTLHGGPGPHKCRVCDYSVKTYGNLIKHESVHEDLEPRGKLKAKSKKPQDNIPTSGTELFKQKTEANQKVAAVQAAPPPPPPLHIDPEFGILMHGSPEFIYPTYLKNGRMKEKRYKCHKCPSAFEKREQYKVHLSLHGSKQRYNCERCDYSVKYYANYIQHLRKHQSNDATKAERKLSTEKGVDDSQADDGTEVSSETTSLEEIQPQLPISCRSAKKMQLSMADQQTTMLMQQRVVSNSVSAPEVTNRCPHCPYTNQRKEGVGSHVKCHSNAKGGAFMCKYCDYTVPQQHFLREHNKLHFTPLKCNRPEAYMKCDRLELWAEPLLEQEDDIASEDKVKKVLIFKDRGACTKENRFLPAYNLDNLDEANENNEKIFINIKTGQVDTTLEALEHSEMEDEHEVKDLNIDNERIEGVPKEEICTDQTNSSKLERNELGTNVRVYNDLVSGDPNTEKSIPMEVDEEKDNFYIDNPLQTINESEGSECMGLDEEMQCGNTNGEETLSDRDQQIQVNGESSTPDCSIAECQTAVKSVAFTMAEPEVQEVHMSEELTINQSQDNFDHQSDGEDSGSKSDMKDSSSGSSDSEDSSSDSSSSSSDSDDSTSSSASQQS